MSGAGTVDTGGVRCSIVNNDYYFEKTNGDSLPSDSRISFG